MNFVKNYAARLLHKLGYEVIPLWRLPDYEKTKLIKSILAHNRIDGVIDVGGNVGQYHDFVRQEVGFIGPIVTFEPIAALARNLTDRVKTEGDADWTIQNYALGQAEEMRAFNITRDTAFASFLQPRSRPGLSAGDMGFDEQVNIVARQQTAVKRLDQVLPNIFGPLGDRRLFLKVDTQGYDLEVLAGARGVLGAVMAIQIEVSLIPVYENMPPMDVTLDALKKLGFHVSGIFPIARDRQLRVIEFDCVLVR